MGTVLTSCLSNPSREAKLTKNVMGLAMNPATGATTLGYVCGVCAMVHHIDYDPNEEGDQDAVFDLMTAAGVPVLAALDGDRRAALTVETLLAPRELKTAQYTVGIGPGGEIRDALVETSDGEVMVLPTTE